MIKKICEIRVERKQESSKPKKHLMKRLLGNI